MVKTAYITILTTVEYLCGLKVTYLSLRQYSNREFVVLVNRNISEDVILELTAMGMVVKRIDDIEIKKGVLSARMEGDRWCNTLYKLRVFGMTEYDYLVYLDSDLLICGNTDELFTKECMSAVSDKTFFPKHGREGINAGVFCFKPTVELESKLIDLIPVVAGKMDVFGDQDVINEYFNTWDKENGKHLDVRYNACFYQLDEYIDVTPLIVHFILGSKPWMWNPFQICLKKIKWILKGNRKQIKYLNRYLKVLKGAR